MYIIFIIMLLFQNTKKINKKISKQFDTLDDAIKNIDDNNIQFGNLILYNFDIPTLKQKFKERKLLKKYRRYII